MAAFNVETEVEAVFVKRGGYGRVKENLRHVYLGWSEFWTRSGLPEGALSRRVAAPQRFADWLSGLRGYRSWSGRLGAIRDLKAVKVVSPSFKKWRAC